MAPAVVIDTDQHSSDVFNLRHTAFTEIVWTHLAFKYGVWKLESCSLICTFSQIATGQRKTGKSKYWNIFLKSQYTQKKPQKRTQELQDASRLDRNWEGISISQELENLKCSGQSDSRGTRASTSMLGSSLLFSPCVVWRLSSGPTRPQPGVTWTCKSPWPDSRHPNRWKLHDRIECKNVFLRIQWNCMNCLHMKWTYVKITSASSLVSIILNGFNRPRGWLSHSNHTCTTLSPPAPKFVSVVLCKYFCL